MSRESDGLRWGPERRVFLRRSLMLAGLTFLTIMAVTRLAISDWRQVLLLALALTLILAMEDFNRWRQVRDERWEIAQGQLLHDGPDGRGAIPLAEIASVKRRLGSAVVITLHSRQRVMMRYLAQPALTVQHINKMRAAEGSFA